MSPVPRSLGPHHVFPVGLGCMPMSQPDLVSDRPRAVATIHAALDAGVTLLDTADIYAPDGARLGHNEELVGQALRTWSSAAAREHVVVATKG
ncbi:MAG: aldo/keto reductase, partial [Myxococcales bacterium]|nr:aldo/keto reductase [Myxococcales bacterium]